MKVYKSCWNKKKVQPYVPAKNGKEDWEINNTDNNTEQDSKTTHNRRLIHSTTNTHNEQHNQQQRQNTARKQLQEQLKRRYTQHLHSTPNNNSKLQWFSHPIQLHDEWEDGAYNETIRIGSINISGISEYDKWLDWEIVLATTHELQIDIMGLTELGINFKNPTINSSFIETSKKYDKHRLIQSSCSNQLLHSKKKRGGTITMASGRWIPRKIKSGADSKGRWSYVTLKGKGTRKVTFITAYRVCQQKSIGTCTISEQQQNDFIETGEFGVNLRKRLITDLKNFITHLHQQDHIVILNGDMNEDLNATNNPIEVMLKECGMINIFHYAMGRETVLPPTYDKGKKCLDLLAITCDARTPVEMINRLGMAPHFQYFNTDHRLLYCDLNIKYLFGDIKHDHTRQVFRTFTSQHAEKSEQYQMTLKEHYNKAKVWDRWAILKEQFSKIQPGHPPPQDLVESIQQLEATASQLMIATAKKIGKRAYATAKPYSTRLTKAGKELIAAKRQLKQIKSIHNYKCHPDINNAIEDVRRSYKFFRLTQKNATEIRNKFLEDLSIKRSLQWNMQQAAALKVIIRSESSKQTFARHGRYLKPMKKGSIQRITIPTPDYVSKDSEGTTISQKDGLPGWMDIDDEDRVFSLLLRQNARHLTQSARSPFAYGKIASNIKFDGTGSLTNDLLDGILDDITLGNLGSQYPQYQPELTTFLKALRRPCTEDGEPLKSFDWKFGMKEFQTLFRKTRESTSCGPSGLHMSHWKVIAEDDILSELWAWIIETAFVHGFTYKRWEVSYHCMLQKRDRPYIHRLRIIQLFEGDFNGALKYILGRVLMYYMSDKGQIHEQCFGSIPGKSAQEAMITLQLLYDNHRLLRKTLASMFNDATGCYDLIRQNLSSVTMQSFGCPSSVAKCHTLNQINLRHHAKTNFGISKEYAKWDDVPSVTSRMIDGLKCIIGNFGGVGQGAGGSPVIWLTVLLIMIKAYSYYEKGAEVLDALGLYTITVYVLSYVDDNSLVRSFVTGTTTSTIINELTRSIMRWRRLLQITGGDLSLEKCSYCILRWRWYGSYPVIESMDNDPGEMTIDDTNIERLDPTKGVRNLGIRLAMSGTFQDELTHRIEQSKKMADLLYRSPLSPSDSFMVYQTRYLPAMRYPLQVTTFTNNELQSIQKPFIHKLLPKIGLNRHTPLAVIHGPANLGGLNIANLPKEQAQAHFERFIGHMRRRDTVSIHLRLSMNIIQLSAGCGRFFLWEDPKKYEYIDQGNRIGFMWKLCCQFNIKLHIAGSWIPQNNMPNANFIMDIAQRDPWFCTIPKYMHSINACRLYLHAFTTTDLLFPGSTIAYSGIFTGQHRVTSPYNFPEQHKPPVSDWNVWTKFLKHSILNYTPQSGGYTLKQPIEERMHTLPTKFNGDGEESILSRYIQGCQKHPLLIIQHLPYNLQILIGSVTLPKDLGRKFYSAIYNDTTPYGGSDGSHKKQLNKGTQAFAFLIKEDSKYKISGSGNTPVCDNLSSSPAEHCGLLGATLLLYIFSYCYANDTNTDTTASLPFFIDNAEVLSRTTRDPTGLNISAYMKQDFDYWRLLRQLLNSLPFHLDTQKIKSHSTGKAANETEKIGRQVNELADQLAEQQYSKSLQSPQRQVYEDSIVTIAHKGNVIQDLHSLFNNIFATPPLLDYYREKGWTTPLLNMVDWKSSAAHLKEVTDIKRCNIIQFKHQWQNIGQQKATFLESKLRHKRKPNCLTQDDIKRVRTEGLCPMGCGNLESNMHYLHCSKRTASKLRQSSLKQLRKHLKEMNTAPLITKHIVDNINHWCNNTIPPHEHTFIGVSKAFKSNLVTALEEQEELGWDKFIRGFISKSWGLAQESWYIQENDISHKHTNDRWSLHLQRGIQTFWFASWDQRNKHIHGGPTQRDNKQRRHRLRARVRALYQKSRHNLPFWETPLFSTPLFIQLRRGNEQLSLWIKRCEMTLANYRQRSQGPIQRDITDYMPQWQQEEEYYYSASDDSTDEEGSMPHYNRQLTITNWLKSHADNTM